MCSGWHTLACWLTTPTICLKSERDTSKQLRLKADMLCDHQELEHQSRQENIWRMVWHNTMWDCGGRWGLCSTRTNLVWKGCRVMLDLLKMITPLPSKISIISLRVTNTMIRSWLVALELQDIRRKIYSQSVDQIAYKYEVKRQWCVNATSTAYWHYYNQRNGLQIPPRWTRWSKD